MRFIIGLAIAVCVALSLAPAAHAENDNNSAWFLIDRDQDGALFARKQDLSNGRSTSRAAPLWTKMYIFTGEYAGQYAITLDTVDCTTRTYRTVTSQWYKANGETSGSYEGNGKVKFAVPDSRMAAIFNILCSDPETSSIGYTS